MIKTNFISLTTVYLLCSLIVLVNSRTRSISPNSLLTQERKPFASPEQPAVLQSYKRTKRQTTKTLQEFQDYVNETKLACGTEMGFSKQELEKSLLYAENMTPKEKCLVACILKRVKIMDKTNKLSTRSVGRIAEIISNGNALVISIAIATADNCNKNVNASEPCEAAYQISKCMSNEMKAHKVKIFY